MIQRAIPEVWSVMSPGAAVRCGTTVWTRPYGACSPTVSTMRPWPKAPS